MSNAQQAADLLERFTHWAAARPDVQAVALVGSYARGAATETSDVDLVVLTPRPDQYLADTGWAQHFGAVARQQIEDYGPLTSLRVWYVAGLEVEYGFTTAQWVQLPLDAGTRRVIADGLRVLFEREPLLSQLPSD